ncbi:hypothetical protein CsatB_009375 [Cannabis sativa]
MSPHDYAELNLTKWKVVFISDSNNINGNKTVGAPTVESSRGTIAKAIVAGIAKDV